MSRERWVKVRDLVEQAMAVPEADRMELLRGQTRQCVAFGAEEGVAVGAVREQRAVEEAERVDTALGRYVGHVSISSQRLACSPLE